jgi:hypothetical protein
MGQATRDGFYRQQEKLRPDDLEADVTLLTIRQARRVVRKDESAAIVVAFKETDKVWWPNTTSIVGDKTGRPGLLDVFSPEFDDATGEFKSWEGRIIPLEKHEMPDGPFKGSVTLWLVDPRLWKDYGVAGGAVAVKATGTVKGSKAAVKPTTKIKGKKIDRTRGR